MLKAIERLINMEGTTFGNHSRYQWVNGIESYMYHGTTICEADHSKKRFTLPYHGQYENSVSTKRAVNDYRRYFTVAGYTEY